MQGLLQYYECVNRPELVNILGTGKENDGASLSLSKREDGGARWIYCYTIHPHRRKMDLGALRLAPQKFL